MARREVKRCPVCGAEVDDGGLQVRMPFIITTSEGKELVIHSECLGDLIAFLIELKKKVETENP